VHHLKLIINKMWNILKCIRTRKNTKIKPRIIQTERDSGIDDINNRLHRIECILYDIIDMQKEFEMTRVKREVEIDTENTLRSEIMEIRRLQRDVDSKKEIESSHENIRIALVDLANKSTTKRGFFKF